MNHPIIHDDDRRRAVIDLFPNISGQINISYIYNNSIAAWHKHKKQTDYWFCVKGSLKVGLCKNGTVSWVYLNEFNKAVLKIDPEVWHGYRALEESVLLYWTTEKYSKDFPDEDRCKIGEFGESWEPEVK